jgi:replicative DNA helicase
MINIDSLLARAKTAGWICPKCGNGQGKDGTGITEDPNNPGHYKCFKCDFYGDVFDVADIVNGDPKGTAFKREGNVGTQNVPNVSKVQKTQKPQITHEKHEKYIEKCVAALAGSPGEAYLKARGFSDETIATARLGYDSAREMITIPYPGVDYYIGRKIYVEGRGKYYKPKQEIYGLEPIYNAAALDNMFSFVTEGQLDALSVIQSGGNAFAIGGAGASKLDRYEKLPEKVCIVADNDDPGDNTARRLQDLLKGRSVKASIVHPPKRYKDANDVLKDDPSLLKDLCIADSWEVWDYKEQESAAAYIDGFWKEARNRTPATPTGFNCLDATLGGGFFEGLYSIGAVSSLGKTTLCLQIADQVAEAGQDVIIFSLEMARSELIAKSLSRLSYRLSPGNTRNAKTARALMDQDKIDRFTPDERDLMRRATEEYKTFASHLWINEGLGTIGTQQIRDAVEKHIEITCQRPLVIVDYLQILASPDPRMSDKQIIDRNVFELKRISRDFKIPLVAVSSFNRNNYSSAVNMAAFKESGAIEYSSDVLIGIQPQAVIDATDGDKKAEAANAKAIDDCKTDDCRKIECKILKNRNGITGITVDFQYLSMFNYIQETGLSKKNKRVPAWLEAMVK